MDDDEASRLLALASALREQGSIREAIRVYERLLAQRPFLADSWYNLGLLRRRAGQYEGALRAYDEALAQHASMPEELHLNKAVILSDDLRRPREARAELDAALRLNPHYIPALLNLGNLAEDEGKIEEARSGYERILALSPGHAIALSRLAGIDTAWADPKEPQMALRAALSAPELRSSDRAFLLFALAGRLDAARNYDQAFEVASAAHEASQSAAGTFGVQYDRGAMERAVAMHKATFSAAEPDNEVRHTPEPVFIVGMFRSGSTLMEQILAAHEAVGAGGEFSLVPRIAQQVQPYPGAIASASRVQLDRLAEAYLTQIRKVHPGTRVVTDKRPDNFVHVGLIKRMFPRARILYTRRNPLDICVSTHFLHIDTSISWASTPADTAHQIIQCSQLMDHWARLYPDDVLTVDYERLLDEPEVQIRAILTFLGLPWSDACLDFSSTPSQVRTASVWQVRQPLHRRSVERWRNYTKWLAEATGMLRSAGLIPE